MGVFDTIRIDFEIPEVGIQPGDEFQTKSLWNVLARMAISSSGRLTEMEGSVGCRELDFHGNILLYRLKDVSPLYVVARFTHGHLEWIRPSSQSGSLLAEDHGF